MKWLNCDPDIILSPECRLLLFMVTVKDNITYLQHLH